MPTKAYRDVQLHLKKGEEACTDNVLHMAGTVKCVVRYNLTGGSSADDQLEIMQSKCATAELLGCIRYGDVQPHSYIIGKKRIMPAEIQD